MPFRVAICLLLTCATAYGQAGEDVGVTIADIDPAKIAEARRAIPSLAQDRPYAPPPIARAAE